MHCRGHLKQQLASFRTLAVILLRSRHYAVFKAVWRYDGRHSAQKLHSLPCGNVAYSCKDICIVGRALLQRVARGNIKPAGHLISIVGVKLAVERQVVAAYATAHHCCVCGKDRAYSKIAALYVENARSCHPFVEVGNHTLRRLQSELYKTLYYLACSISKERRIYVLPVAAYGIQFELLPEICKYGVFGGDEGGVIHKNHCRRTRNVPVPYPYPQPLTCHIRAPGGKELLILCKLRILSGLPPYIGTYENM